MKVKIELAVFRMRDSGMIFTLNVHGLEDRNADYFKSGDDSEFIGFQFVEVEV